MRPWNQLPLGKRILVLLLALFLSPAEAVLVPMYSSYSPGAINYFYTTDVNQHRAAIASHGYGDQGIAFYVENTQLPGTLLNHRYLRHYPYSDHFYSVIASEQAYVRANGWVFEGYEGYYYPPSSPQPGTVPLYRLFWANWSTLNYAHFYTTSPWLRDWYRQSGWSYDGVVGYVWASAAAKQWDAAFVRQSIPPFIETGVIQPISVTMRNTGWGTWRLGEWFLATAAPQDSPMWCFQNTASPGRVHIPHEVAPGQEVTFNFNIRPYTCNPLTVPGPPMTFTMLSPIYETHGEKTPNVVTGVGYAATPVGAISAPAQMESGKKTTIQVTMKNTGTETWTEGGLYRLGSQAPQDNMTWGVGRVYLPAGVAIAPGQQHTFTFDVIAPSTTGSYPMQWQMVRDGVRWMGQPTNVLTVEVRSVIDRGKRPPGTPPSISPPWSPPPGNPFGFNCC
jgi:hypothetical protein